MKDYLKDDFISTGQILMQIREEKGLTQHELANRCTVDRAKISMIENGHLDPRLSTFLELARGLGVHISRFFPSPADSK